MERVYQIYEKAPVEITTPEELRGRAVQVIFHLLDEGEPTLAELAAEAGMKLEDFAFSFIGSVHDFPPREAQGEYEVRPEPDVL